jgi:K+-transporting ATPase KdpF subunit
LRRFPATHDVPDVNVFLILFASCLINAPAAQASVFSYSYERLNFRRNHHGFLSGERPLRPLLRKTVGDTMETIVVSVIALLLFAYLFVAMIWPEKF